MFVESGAYRLVTYCAQLVSIHARKDSRIIDMWEPVLEHIQEQLPHGSGFNAGTIFDVEASKPDKLVFRTSFHHMNDGGFYDGWTEHVVTVVPAFNGNGFDIRVSGRNRNAIKDYIADQFHDILSEYAKTSFDKENQLMKLVPAQFDYGFNGPISRD